MSTTFGIKTKTYSNQFDDLEDVVIPIAKRSNGIRWINDIAPCLSDDTPVIAMDNSPQGIFTIGDIKKDIANDTKSPIGIMSKTVHDNMREVDLKAAIDRYQNAGIDVPDEWLVEYMRLMFNKKT